MPSSARGLRVKHDENEDENENGQMKIFCPFGRDQHTSNMGIEAWLAETATETFARMYFQRWLDRIHYLYFVTFSFNSGQDFIDRQE